MEQKYVIDKFYVHGTATLRTILQVLANLSSDGLSRWVETRRPMKGETGLYKLLNSKEPVTVTFLNQKADLNKLKKYLDELGLPFSFKETKEGTNLYFKVKDEALAQEALGKTLGKILDNATRTPGDFAKKVVQKPNSMTFEQRLRKAKEQSYQGEHYRGVVASKSDALLQMPSKKQK